MNGFLEVLVANTLVSGCLAVAGALVWRIFRHAPIAHALLLLALLKLITPPLVDIGVQIPGMGDADTASTAVVPTGDRPFGRFTADQAGEFGMVHGVPGSVPFGPMSAPPVRGPVALPEHAESPLMAVLPADSWFSQLELKHLVAGALGVWVIGMSVMIFLLLRRGRLCARLLARAEVAPAPVIRQAHQLAASLGLRSLPDMRVIEARLSPFVFALTGRVTVVLPKQLIRDLDAADVRAVLAHELSHVANRDHWTRWLEVLVMVVHWWNPIALWMRRQLDEIGEVRCDSRAIEVLASGARPYGRSILRVTSQLEVDRAVTPLGASGFGGSNTLKRRITMIAESKLSHRLSWPARCAVLVGALGLLPMGITAQEKSDKSDTLARILKALEKHGIETGEIKGQLEKALEGAGSKHHVIRIRGDDSDVKFDVKVLRKGKHEHGTIELGKGGDRHEHKDVKVLHFVEGKGGDRHEHKDVKVLHFVEGKGHAIMELLKGKEGGKHNIKVLHGGDEDCVLELLQGKGKGEHKVRVLHLGEGKGHRVLELLHHDVDIKHNIKFLDSKSGGTFQFKDGDGKVKVLHFGDEGKTKGRGIVRIGKGQKMFFTDRGEGYVLKGGGEGYFYSTLGDKKAHWVIKGDGKGKNLFFSADGKKGVWTTKSGTKVLDGRTGNVLRFSGKDGGVFELLKGDDKAPKVLRFSGKTKKASKKTSKKSSKKSSKSDFSDLQAELKKLAKQIKALERKLKSLNKRKMML